MNAASSRVAAAVSQTLRHTLWAPIALVLLHFVLRATGIYHEVADLDLVMHFTGGLLISYVAARFVGRARRAALFVSRHPAFDVLLIFSVTVTAAVCWEFFELLLDRFGDANVDNGRVNTLEDLASGMAGACTFIALWWSQRRVASDAASQAPSRDRVDD